MLQCPLLITCPKASDYLHNKGEIDMNHNLVTESKVTKCNEPYNCYAKIGVIQALKEEWTGLCQMSFSRACVRDAWKVSRHKKGTHIIGK